ncbi:hypothetical protein QFC19_007605 [Naganishia cerealis]|uniref:Uncharacterized protein n=1 Tax=Naganishia cerealis TaxID=610337 RepID=A0ACC2V8G9_9TREE|nr:hypothetical protein QFC19_007605 [Naganishia cerealis]
MLEEMWATLLHHSQCLNDPVEATFDPDENEQSDRFSCRQRSNEHPPWLCFTPPRQIHASGNVDERFEREIDLLQIPDEHDTQVVCPIPVIGRFKGGIHPEDELHENEARKDGNMGSAAGGVELISNVNHMGSQDSATTTGVDLLFLNDGSSGTFHQARLPDDSLLRRRRPERRIVNGAETLSLFPASSQCTIALVQTPDGNSVDTSANGRLSQDIGTSAEQGPPENEENESYSGASSPELTESSLVDITSYAASAFSVSSSSDSEHVDLSHALHRRFLQPSTRTSMGSARASSPAFSSSSYEILSSPGDIASMPTSPHSTNASISLDTYPPFDEYNRSTYRYMNIRPPSQNSHYTFSESSWTDGDLTSDDPYREI